MEHLGIVRRIDELGRIVIPKGMRNAMRLKVGDEMEIYSFDDAITLKRFNRYESIKESACAVAKLLAEYAGADAIIVDSSKVVIAEGENKKTYINRNVWGEFSDAISKRRSVVLHGDDLKSVFENAECNCCYLVYEPIVVGGDNFGGIAILLNSLPSDVARAYLKFCAELIGTNIK